MREGRAPLAEREDDEPERPRPPEFEAIDQSPSLPIPWYVSAFS